MIDREDLKRARNDARTAFYRFLDEALTRLPEPPDVERYLRLRRALDLAQRSLDRWPQTDSISPRRGARSRPPTPLPPPRRGEARRGDHRVD
jgi:hypothetical protein